MKKKLPKVLILYTGGTFGMDTSEEPDKELQHLDLPALSPRKLKNRFLERVPELQRFAKCDVEIVLNRDSAHIGPPEWLLFSQKIKSKWKHYDGIVLLHGTDTLAYTASALSFLLRPCIIPIVITGAQRPLSALRTDARNNLISAVEIAAHGPREIVKQVSVFFADKLFQGNRIRKFSSNDFEAFDSPHSSPLAVIGTTIRYAESTRLPRPKKELKLQSHFEGKVLLVHMTPGFPAKPVTEYLLPHLDAIILDIFHCWTAPTQDPWFMKFLQTAKTLNIPIILVTQDKSQHPQSENIHVQYAAGNALLSQGCLSAGSMTPECAYVKTLHLLAQGGGLKKFISLWTQDLAGEGTSSNS